MSRCKVSQVVKSCMEFTDVFLEFDAMLNPAAPSNPWIHDDQTYWILNQPM
jgi:regulator of G-protein signaling